MNKKAVIMKYSIIAFFSLIFLFLLISSVNSTTWTESLDNGLFAYYNFSGTTESVHGGSYDLVTSGINGQFTAFGLVGGSAYNNGSVSSCYNISKEADIQFAFNTSASMSINFWLYNNNTGYFEILNSENKWEPSWGMGMKNTQEGYITFGNNITLSTTTIQSKNWTMITATKNTTSVCIYLNSILEKCQNIPSVPSSSDPNIQVLGNKAAGDGLTGFIDELGFWNRTLSSGDITQLYNDGSGIAYAPGTIDTIKPYFTYIPTNVSINYSFGFGVDFNATDETNFGTFAVNNTDSFQINSSGYLTNSTANLTAKEYFINISINDSSNNLNSTIYLVNISKGTPILTYYINSQTENISMEFPNKVNASAYANVGTVSIYRDDVNKTSENGQNVSLSPGNYTYVFNVTGNANYSSITNITMNVNITPIRYITGSLANNLTAYWNFDEADYPILNQVNTSSYSSTARTDIAYSLPGILGTAINFSSTASQMHFDTIRMKYNETIGEGFTLSFWYYWDVNTTETMDSSIFTYKLNADNYVQIFTDSSLGLRAEDKVNTNIQFDFREMPLNRNNLTHIVLQIKDNNATFWSNGTIVSTDSVVAYDNINANFVSFGTGFYTSFPGRIDEAGWWDRFLNTSEVLELYNNGIGITYSTDIIAPDIQITSPINNSNSSDNTLNIEYTRSDAHTINCFYSNDTYTKNTTLTSCGNITDVVWTDSQHNVTIWARDNVGNLNYSRVSFRIDTTAPDITIDNPKEQSYSTNISLALDFIVSDLTEVDSCWYNLINKTGGGMIIANTTLANCLNTTFNLPGIDNDYNLTLYSNDTLGTEGFLVRTFGIRMSSPSVALNSPANNEYLNYSDNIYFNFTAVKDIGLDTFILYLNGLSNYTWIKPTNNTMNFTILNLEEGKYNWTVGGNDTAGNFGWALNNFSLTIDLTNPDVSILTTNLTSFTGLSFNISYEINDTNLDVCYYTLRDSTGAVHNYPENNTLSCNSSQVSLSTLVYDDFTIRIWGEDLLNHLNTDVISFTTTAPITAPAGGGGGEKESKSSTVCLTATGNVTRLSNLSRCIIYARIREECSGKIGCVLNQATDLLNKLSTQTVKIDAVELMRWLGKYNNNELEVSKILDSDIKKYNLFTSIIQIDTLRFSPNPNRLDLFYFAISKKPFEYYPIQFNRLISKVNVLNGSYPGFSGKVISNSTSVIYLNLSNYEFLADTFVGTFEYTSQENETAFQEVQVRTFNFLNYWTWIISASIISGGIVLIILRKKITNLFKRKKR